MNNAIRTITKDEAIVLDSIAASSFQKKGTVTATLRQDVVTTAFYPSMRPTNSMSDNLFNSDEFAGTEEQEFTSTSHRVAFMNVPEGTTPEQIAERLSKLPKARIYRVLSNQPILTSEQITAIANGITTRDVIAEKQISRYQPGTENEGQIIKDTNSGKPFYRATYFSADGKADIDLRTSDPADLYLSPALEAELGMGTQETVNVPVASSMQEA